AKRFGSTVSCVNLCPEQNRKNLEAAKQLALDRYIELYEMDFTELDKSWNGTFDLAYSIDAFCHCLDKRTALQEARRVLSPEGVFVLTDILIGDGYERSKLDSFAKHNVGRLASLDEYSADFDAAGWNQTSCHDLSQHLGPFFRKMREKLESEQEQLLSIGMGAQYIEAYARSLKERERLMEEGAFSWKCFVLQK
ncbi:MAG: class I SAM-dependent methyltransferase, partial [Opitutales bacterium]